MFISIDSGATWAPAGTPITDFVYGVASSADGSRLVAVCGDGSIFTVQPPTPTSPLWPRLELDLSGAKLVVSWLVPSTPFVLQETSDLGTGNWVDVAAGPTLDYTNLHQRVSLTPSSGSRYYRLKQR